MIVRGGDGQRHSLFGLFAPDPIPRPSQWGGTLSHAGERISFESAAGLPAFLRGVRLISETCATMEFEVYRGKGDAKVEVEDGPVDLLEQPNPDQPSFAFWQYFYTSLLRGNAYIWKLKVGNQVRALYPVNPSFVTPKYDGATPVFELRDRQYGPVVKTVGKSEIIHVPGITLEDPYVGISVVEAHRHGLGTELGRQRFEGRYIANDGSPGVLLKHPGAPTLDQRREVRDSYEARHVGSGNAGRVGMVWGGWDLTQTPVSLQDSQFIEAKRYAVQDIGRMLGIPSALLNDPEAQRSTWTPEQVTMEFLQFGCRPWMDRAESGLRADADLFPGPGWCVELDEHDLLRADIKTRFEAYRLGRQGGWITANEIREMEGQPPVEGGDVLQETPVGGAANPGTSAVPTNAGAEDGTD